MQNIPWKSHVFTIFYVEINFCLYFTHKMAISHFFWAPSHYDVKVTSYINGWYLFWYQWEEDVHTYTLVVNLGLYDLSIDNPRGVGTTPLRKICLGKTLRIRRVKKLSLTNNAWGYFSFISLDRFNFAKKKKKFRRHYVTDWPLVRIWSPTVLSGNQNKKEGMDTSFKTHLSLASAIIH